MEENYFSYYLLKVIENDMKYMLQEKKKGKFFSKNAISLAVYSFVIHSPPCTLRRLSIMKHSVKKMNKKKVYYFFKIYCKNPHFQIFIAALAGILACSFVIYSEHST